VVLGGALLLSLVLSLRESLMIDLLVMIELLLKEGREWR
jgi:hypothetical protein